MEGTIQSLADYAFGKDLIKGLNEVLTIDINNTLEYIHNIEQISIPIGAVLLCIYLVIEVMEKVTEGNFTTEQFLKILIKLAFGQFLISNATAFVLQFMNVGVAFMNSITAGVMEMPTITANLKDVGLIEQIGLAIMMILPAAVGFVIQLAVKIMGYTRNLEMIVRAMFAPIGMADVIHGGANSHGMKYLKDCLAIALQGAIMMGITIAAAAVMNTALAGLSEGGITLNLNLIVTYFGVMGGMVGLLGQSKSIAKDIVG